MATKILTGLNEALEYAKRQRSVEEQVKSAIAKLRAAGKYVAFSDMPGLFIVDGYPELTTHQLLQIASE
jgi:hypothetical protein